MRMYKNRRQKHQKILVIDPYQTLGWLSHNLMSKLKGCRAIELNRITRSAIALCDDLGCKALREEILKVRESYPFKMNTFVA